MDLVVCPNCMNRVLPSQDRVCPHCREKIVGESQFVPIVVHSGVRLPPFCIACDLPAEKWKRWERSRMAGDPDRASTNAMLAGVVSEVMGYFWKRSQMLDVVVEVPLCRQCEWPREPEPQFEEALITLTVGRSFARRFQ